MTVQLCLPLRGGSAHPTAPPEHWYRAVVVLGTPWDFTQRDVLHAAQVLRRVGYSELANRARFILRYRIYREEHKCK